MSVVSVKTHLAFEVFNWIPIFRDVGHSIHNGSNQQLKVISAVGMS